MSYVQFTGNSKPTLDVLGLQWVDAIIFNLMKRRLVNLDIDKKTVRKIGYSPEKTLIGIQVVLDSITERFVVH